MSYKVIGGKVVKEIKKPSFRRLWRGHVGEPSMDCGMISPPIIVPPDMSSKGKYLGLCNRSACLKPGADWYNRGSLAYYCKACATLINVDGCRQYGEPDLCYPAIPLS